MYRMASETREELTGRIAQLLGLWRDREDIGDSVRFARELRRRVQQRREE